MTDFSGNTVGGSLTCQNNSDLTVASNTVKGSIQCVPTP